MIDKLNPHYSMTNPASVYDEEALTALELAGRTTGKVNECVEAVNKFEKDIPVQVEEAVVKHIENGEFDEAIDKYAGELTERVNNIVASTGNDDTEIVDGRLTAYGTVCPTIGESIREQFNQLADGTCKTNLIDMNKLTSGYLQTTGDVHPSHQTGTFQRWEYTTDYIPVSLDTEYQLTIKHKGSKAGWYAISVYDSNKRFINRDRTYEYNAETLKREFIFDPDFDIAYVRISYRSFMDAEIKFEHSEYPTPIEKKATARNNLIDSYPLQFDGYIVTNGSVYPATENAEKYTRHIPVTAGEEFTLYNISASNQWYRVGFYNANGEGIQNVSGTENKTTFTIPTDCVSIMVSARTASKPLIGLFKTTNVMTSEQQTFENYLSIVESKSNAASNNVDYDMYVKGIAHRGYAVGDEIPENTASAFIEAYKRGFKYVECDVRMTADGCFFLCYDETVDRVSNGTGKVSELSYDDMKDLTVGNNEKFLDLDEFLILCKRYGLKPYIELKGDNLLDETGENALDVITYVIKHGMVKQTTFLSFNPDMCYRLLSSDSRLRVGLLIDSFDSSLLENDNIVDLIDTVVQNQGFLGEFFICCQHSIVGDCLYHVVMNQIPLEVWTCDDVEYIKSMSTYITGVISNTVHAGRVLHDSESDRELVDNGWDEIEWPYQW